MTDLDDSVNNQKRGGVLKSGQVAPDAKASPESVIDSCFDLAERFSISRLPQFLEAVDETLYELAETASSDIEEGRVYDSLRFMRQRRASMEERFMAALELGFDKFKRGEPLGYQAQHEVSFDKLSLLQNDELEESIAVSSVGHKAESQFSEHLYGVCQRLSVLRGGEKVKDENNPVGPLHFCHCLKHALEIAELDIKPRVIAFKIYDREFISQLGDFYDELNDLFISRGILTHLRPESAYQDRVSESLSAGRQETPDGSSSGEGVPDKNISSRGSGSKDASSRLNPLSSANARSIEEDFTNILGNKDEVENRLNQFASVLEEIVEQDVESEKDESQFYPKLINSIEKLQGQLNQHISKVELGQTASKFVENAQATDSVMSNDETQDIIEALSILQMQAAELSLAYTPKTVWEPIQRDALRYQIRNQLVKPDNSAEERQIPSADLNTIDLVGMLFDYMLDDMTIPDSVKALLCHLHTPYLKVSILDTNFFKQMQHPARVLLDRISEAGALYVDPGDTKDKEVFDKIEEIVARILRDYKSDTRLFAELLMDFTTFINKLRRRSEILEKRAIEKARGEDRLKEVKRIAFEEIQIRIKHVDLPAPVTMLLLQPWSDYLTFLLLRYGDSSGAWTQALQTVEDIVWSIEPKKNANDKAKLKVLVGELEVALLRGLETIGYEQSHSQELLEQLHSFQELALRDENVPRSSYENVTLDVPVPEEEGSKESLERLSNAEKEVMELLSEIEFGTQFIFHKTVLGQSAKLKVAWFNENTQHYMFVDQLGKKVTVKGAVELSRLIVNGDVEIVENVDKPLVERALESIFRKINKSLGVAKDGK